MANHMTKLIATLALGSLALGGAVAAQAPADTWTIGPVIKGRNYSVGMPATLQASAQGPSFEFPTTGRGHVHYVTLDGGALPQRGTMVLRYRIDAAPGTRFVSQETPGAVATISMVFQRAGDTWTARGAYANYRWYAPSATVAPVSPGEHTIRVSLSDPAWVNVNGQNSGNLAAAYSDALANGVRAGFVFGTSQARGHGVYATGPSRFTVLDFRID